MNTQTRHASAAIDSDTRPVTAATELGTILGVWAHPDDEAYLMGGTMALATDAGQHVACVTATVGEAGETADEVRWPTARLATIRCEELSASLATLGVHDHQWLGHPDGGLASVEPATGIAQVAQAIERVRPDTVLTFGPDGMTGHRDHQIISAWTRAAFAASAGRDARLLAATRTTAWAERFPEINAEVFPDGAPTTPPEMLFLTTTLEGEVLDRKVRALEAQASQTTTIIGALGRDRFAQWIADEHWVQLAC